MTGAARLVTTLAAPLPFSRADAVPVVEAHANGRRRLVQRFGSGRPGSFMSPPLGDQVLVLEAGADGCLLKACGLRELTDERT
ncbi:hypothetical protein ABZ153_01115 [Streptomyces sp. NPDC006290]|uniref:hypothetical protein n=1 Tax=Streptomyces sp. NPDC006290 TaxID=3156745 RepID=UPI0033BAD5CF